MTNRPVDPDDTPDDDGLDDQERQSLTMWGTAVSAQVRTGHNLETGNQVATLAVHHLKGAARSSENGRPWMIPAADARKLRDVLNAATDRGDL